MRNNCDKHNFEKQRDQTQHKEMEQVNNGKMFIGHKSSGSIDQPPSPTSSSMSSSEGKIYSQEVGVGMQDGQKETEEIMLKDNHNFSGAIRSISGSSSGINSYNRVQTRDRDYITDHDDDNHNKANHHEVGDNGSKDRMPNNGDPRNSFSSYLILSPSSPIRGFAISFLTHWIYSTVIIVTICAFTFSSVYSYYCGFSGVGYNNLTSKDNSRGVEQVEIPKEFNTLEVTRLILFMVLLSEVVIKSLARGFLLTGKFSYLRILWDWLDVLSLALIFVSIIIPWKAVEFVAAAIVLLKLIPIHPGSINAFIFLCSCAKKLIPVLVYGFIMVWLYGLLIFTLFVKYQQQREALFVQDEGDDHVTDPTQSVLKSNESTGDTINKNSDTFKGNLVNSPSGEEGDLFLMTLRNEQFQNFSFRLTMECLPTNFRSLSGSLIQAIKMLTLQKHSSSLMESSGSTTGSTTETSCQSEMYLLSIIETLVIITGTLPMISMALSTLLNLFQAATKRKNPQSSFSYHNHPPLNRSESGESGGSQQRQDTSLSSCFNTSFNEVANILCDCDYYFCCLANLQRRLYPCASGLLNSKKFKVFLLLVVSTDFLSTILLLWFTETSNCTIDFSKVTSTWIMTCYVKMCIVIYTLEALFKWFALASDEYWMNVWSGFDLSVIFVHWIGYAIIHLRSYPNPCETYIRFCGILMIRMLKVVPYWQSLEQSLKVTWFSILGNRHNLFVILICSCSSILVKYAAIMLETRWTSQNLHMDLMSTVPLNFYTFVDYVFQLLLYFLFGLFISAIYFKVFEVLKTPHEGSNSNPSISLFLNNHRDSQFSETTIMSSSTHHLHHTTEPRQSFNGSSSPISVMHGVQNSIHHQSKFRLASSPCESHSGLLLTPDRRSIISPRSSDVLSPLLTVPISNGLNGHASLTDGHSQLSDENVQLRHDNTESNFSINRTRHCFAWCSSMEDALNLISTLVLILSSLNITLADPEKGKRYHMTWNSLYLGRSLWIEVIFIMGIALHIIFKTRLARFPHDTFLQITALVDLIVILAAAAEVYSSGMRWVPVQPGSERENTFLQCAKILSACRGLLAFSRVSWLQCIGSALCYLFWKVLRYLNAFLFLWTIFIVSVTELQKMIMSGSITRQNETNPTEEAASSTLSNATVKGTGANVTMLSTNATSVNEGNFMIHHILWTISILLILLSSGVLLGFLHQKLENLFKVIEKFMTSNQVAYQRSKRWQSQQFQFLYSVTDPSSKPTEGTCVPILYFVTNHHTFDVIVMVIILLDGLGITLEHFASSGRSLILRKHYPAYMLFLYTIELISKLVGNGCNFFKSYWNIFDCVIISTSLIDFFISLVYQNWILLLIQNIRFLRILRIFQFFPFVKRTKIIQGFYLSVPKVMFILWNFLIFYFCLYLAAVILRMRCADPNESDMSTLSILANPFANKVNLQNVFTCLGNSCLTRTNFSYMFYILALLLFSLIKFSLVFVTCFVFVTILFQYLGDLDDKANCKEIVSRSISFHHDDDDMTHVQSNAEVEDKSSYVMPCITPDTSHDTETPTSSARTSSRYNNPSSSSCTSTRFPDTGSNEKNTESTGLYNTTTFTSTREINGCKVFFVEAMITTV